MKWANWKPSYPAFYLDEKDIQHTTFNFNRTCSQNGKSLHSDLNAPIKNRGENVWILKLDALTPKDLNQDLNNV